MSASRKNLDSLFELELLILVLFLLDSPRSWLSVDSLSELHLFLNISHVCHQML